MGRSKALLELWGRALVVAQVERLLAVVEGPVLVVVGCQAPALRRALAGQSERLEIVENIDWATTDMAHSLRIALPSLAEVDPVLVTPVDAPPAERDALVRLLATPPPACLGHGGRRGHPLLATVRQLEAALASGSLRELRPAPEVVEAGSPDVLRNLNTPEAWQSWREQARDARGPGAAVD